MTTSNAPSTISRQAIVITAPVPADEPKVTEYRVFVNGKEVELYTSRDQAWEKEYYYGSFDFQGKISVRVQSSKSLSNVLILPAEKYGIQHKLLSDTELTFDIDKPFRIAIERDGRVRPLMLFGNELETDVPSPDDPNVIYFAPGSHHPGVVQVSAGQTVYLAAGAVVHGGIEAVGDNIKICGRGLLAGDPYERFKGPMPYLFRIQHGNGIEISGIMMRNSWSWTLTVWHCANVLLDNVKICCSNMINDDAVDLCNTSNAVVKNCFFRTQDDVFAIKGMDANDPTPCENIHIEGCECWTDSANIFRIAFESESSYMANITADNLEILHYSEYCGPEHYWSHAIIWLQPSKGMTLKDCHFKNFHIYSNGEDMCVIIAKMMCCKLQPIHIQMREVYEKSGSVDNCTFENFTVTGTPGVFRGELHFEGRGEEETVKNIAMRNFTYFGKKLTQDFEHLILKDYTSGITLG